MKRCKNCGQAHDDDTVKFCKACGTPFSAPVAENVSSVHVSPLQNDFSLDDADHKPAFSYYIDAFKNYAKFSGRATRKQFWMFILFNFLINFTVGFCSGFFDGLAGSLYSSRTISLSTARTLLGVSEFFSVVLIIYSLAVMVPALAINWRRMHDINKSGAWCFITLIPIAGLIWYIVLCCQPGDEGENDFGVPSHLEDKSSEHSAAPYVPNSTVGAVKANSSKCAKIIRVLEDRVSVGCSDGSFFDVSIKELDFQPVVGDVVYVFSNGDAKIVTKNELF
ncbi:MAG: DUF805 domain-containing protein [Fibrobacter sp.]|nr:DUF805 domain-containing protein [Fibrobacter sp.]